VLGSTDEGLGVDIRMNSTRVGNCVRLLLLEGANVGDSLDWKLGGSVGDMITDGLELEARLGTKLGMDDGRLDLGRESVVDGIDGSLLEVKVGTELGAAKIDPIVGCCDDGFEVASTDGSPVGFVDG